MRKENGGRTHALRILEESRQAYLMGARDIAEQIARHGDGTCTVDSVREKCPPPKEIDGRVMGAIFNTADWEHLGYVRSDRVTCHKRPISRFRFVGGGSLASKKGDSTGSRA